MSVAKLKKIQKNHEKLIEDSLYNMKFSTVNLHQWLGSIHIK